MFMKSKLYLAFKYSCLVFFILVIALFVTLDSARAINYGGVGGRPAYPRAENPRTDDIFVHTLKPGASQTEGVLVVNNSDETKTLMVYSADSTPSTEGGFACKQLSEPKNDVGSWITFGAPQDTFSLLSDPAEDDDRDGLLNQEEEQHSTDPNDPDTDNDGFLDGTEVNFGYDPLGAGILSNDGDIAGVEISQLEGAEEQEDITSVDADNSGMSNTQPVLVELSPYSNVLVPFTIVVPPDASVGEHDGCVLVQEKKERQQGQTGVVLSTRTGLRVAITIPGNIIRQLEIVNLQILERTQGGKILHPIVKNSGNVSIDTEVKVLTKSFFGVEIAEHGGEYTILRSDTAEWNFEFEPSFWGGWYKSFLTVEYDSSSEASTGIESSVPKTVLKHPVVWFFIMPSIGALIIYLIVLLFIILLIFLWWLSRKRKKWISTKWVGYEVKSGDGLKALAQRYDASWRLLAKVNKIKPPYELKPGSVIKVPPKDDK